MAQNTEQKTTYYLEMAGRDDLRLPERTGTAFEIRRVEIACPEFNWFLHDAVGVEDVGAWVPSIDHPVHGGRIAHTISHAADPIGGTKMIHETSSKPAI